MPPKKQVRIIPHTRHLQNRVDQHGDVWNIIVENDDGRVLVQSLDKTFRGANGVMEHDLRWLERGDFIRL